LTRPGRGHDESASAQKGRLLHVMGEAHKRCLPQRRVAARPAWDNISMKAVIHRF